MPPAWLKPMIIALAIGTAGGFAFRAVGAPMPWILGAMFANIAAAMSGVQARVPMLPITVMMGILGIMSGSSFGPGFLDQVPQWIDSLLVVVAFVFIVAAATYYVLRRFFAYSMLTAYFCAAPGGLTMMAILGQAMGGDVRQISLVHTTRLALTLVVISAWLELTGHTAVDPVNTGSAIADLSYTDMALMIGCVVFGIMLADKLKIDGGSFLGPLFLSAAIHLSGVNAFDTPGFLAAIAQVVMGSNIGTRFGGTSIARLAGMVGIGTMTGTLALTCTIIMTVIMAGPLQVPGSALLLSLAPAGFPMMVLTAIALDLDVAFVTTHQLARIAIITALGPPLIRYIARKSGIIVRDLSKE
jgi:uncharacterized protein